MGSSRGQSSIGSLSLMGSGGGSSVGGSSVGPSASSVGSTLTAESLQAMVAAEIAKALGTSAQVPPSLPPAGNCRFCGGPFAACVNQCAEATRAFNAMREQINKVANARKAKEAAAAAKAAEADK